MSIKPLTLTNLSPGDVVPNSRTAGVIPIGNFKGQPAFWDLDKANNQPLVAAEQLHILGNIDGAGVEGLVAITVPAGAVAGTLISGTITVPATEVWYINAVVGTCAADATGTIIYNWRCLLFPDAANNVLGGVYHTAWLATPVGAPPLAGWDEFSPIATLFLIGNKPILLRLPGGTTITGQLQNAVGAANATGVAGTFQLFGFKGRPLVA